MSNQVHLSPTKLSILSIPRDKVWLFTAPILRLLKDEAQKSNSQSVQGDDSEQDEDDLSDDESSDNSNSGSVSGDQLARRESLKRSKSDNGVDNSSKPAQSTAPSSASELESSDDDDEEEAIFFHVALTPTECTVICSSAVFQDAFDEPLKICKQLDYADVVAVEEPFINLQVDSDGESHTSSRILELTRPLSENDIPLFFLSSHFTDIVLIPHKAKDEVVRILGSKQFEFSDVSNSYFVNTVSGVESKIRHLDINSSELEEKTLKLFENNGISPKINRKQKLLLTGARPGRVKDAIEKAAMCIGSGSLPDYFVITRTSLNELSLILPGSARKRAAMGYDFKSIIGSAQDIILPIAIDLRKLPLDLTGIVAGLASRILSSCEASIEMNYLSMARSGVVMIPEENLGSVAQVVNSINYRE
ncbi:hypothetical protein FT663_01674 [Candidozyma haemuli var. vulneris]|uniref:CASTOR ACT domain-containing protein n=1 Tax=Candidozyma haemuli TaxID=45357 RepID=A0A2V1ARW8_9ASCO|nr:hypothetical protein CXQ85_001802 [[Candida] haemuloni]KAF3990599.1 hypothetical protein FT662_02160 [[Candida] haemuloni var. vulneris]KAF3993964.1 hypothetical protein FT663_01674 [[Candida] haemuloni var. vulneris]PVH20023.1 hypothetical protein CXQ85_001802 [[Candida] haemuloni]